MNLTSEDPKESDKHHSWRRYSLHIGLRVLKLRAELSTLFRLFSIHAHSMCLYSSIFSWLKSPNVGLFLQKFSSSCSTFLLHRLCVRLTPPRFMPPDWLIDMQLSPQCHSSTRCWNPRRVLMMSWAAQASQSAAEHHGKASQNARVQIKHKRRWRSREVKMEGWSCRWPSNTPEDQLMQQFLFSMYGVSMRAKLRQTDVQSC